MFELLPPSPASLAALWLWLRIFSEYLAKAAVRADLTLGSFFLDASCFSAVFSDLSFVDEG